MRGPDEQTRGMFSYLSPEQRVRPDHPLRAVRRMTDQVIATLSPRFTKMCSDIGRTPNKVTVEARAFCAGIIDDPKYQAQFRRRALEGKLPPQIEVMS